MSKIDCKKIVEELRSDNYVQKKVKALKQIYLSNDLWEKCVLLRKYTSPQSTDAEKMILRDLEIDSPVDKVSGDGKKGKINYEIKVSVHDTKCMLNIRQIRPHHNVDYYILVSFNLLEGDYGEAYVFKVPVKIIYELVAEYGGYTHGTVERNGKITPKSIIDPEKDFEYSLSANPNGSEESKSKKLWNELLKYKVEYDKDNF